MRDGSGVVSYRYTFEDVDARGNVRVYFQRNGQKKIRLRETPGTEAFAKEYRAAFEGVTPPAEAKHRKATYTRGTLRWLVTQYLDSAAFKGLGPTTRKVRRHFLDEICELNGNGAKRYCMMKPRHVMKIRDHYAGTPEAPTPEAANGRLKALRALFKWANDPSVEYATDNPAARVPVLPPTNPDGFHTWTVDEVERYWERYPLGTQARLAIDLLLFTGVRISDVVKLAPGMVVGDALKWTETKGRSKKPKHRELPVLPELRASIDAAPSGHLVFLATKFGKPFSAKGFGNKFRRWCDAAGLIYCSAHGLRKAGATIAAENGATELQLMSIYGWTSPKNAAIYTRKANRVKIAAEAMQLVVPRKQR
jgi:integrase